MGVAGNPFRTVLDRSCLTLCRHNLFLKGGVLCKSESDGFEGFEDSRPISPCPLPGETRQVFHPNRYIANMYHFAVDLQGYAKHAWGADELQPLTRKGTNSFRLGLTIVRLLFRASIGLPSAWLLPHTVVFFIKFGGFLCVRRSNMLSSGRVLVLWAGNIASKEVVFHLEISQSVGSKSHVVYLRGNHFFSPFAYMPLPVVELLHSLRA